MNKYSIIVKIEEFGKDYESVYLDEYDNEKLISDWWLALNFIFSPTL